MLAAADRLFAAAEQPSAVSMEAIAAEAGVGKGTLFRAFGSRDSLLDALSEAKMAPVQAAIERQSAEPGASGTPVERAVALLDAFLVFKLDNRYLARAREAARPGALRRERYTGAYARLEPIVIEVAGAGTDAAYLTHALLAAMHVEILDELIAQGRTADDLRRAQAALVRATLRRG